jgi:hypothetical protein
MYCYECENTVDDGAPLCPHCGFDNSILHSGKRLFTMAALVIRQCPLRIGLAKFLVIVGFLRALKMAELDEIQVVNRMPDVFGRDSGERFPEDMIGATILRIGTPENSRKRLEGGGLVVDYLPAGASNGQRVVLSFTELGMMLVGSFQLDPTPNLDERSLSPS